MPLNIAFILEMSAAAGGCNVDLIYPNDGAEIEAYAVGTADGVAAFTVAAEARGYTVIPVSVNTATRAVRIAAELRAAHHPVVAACHVVMPF